MDHIKVFPFTSTSNGKSSLILDPFQCVIKVNSGIKQVNDTWYVINDITKTMMSYVHFEYLINC